MNYFNLKNIIIFLVLDSDTLVKIRLLFARDKSEYWVIRLLKVIYIFKIYKKP